MKVLVTGGAGFIGSHIIDQLVGLGHEVRSLDVLHPAAHRTEPDYLNADADYLWGDVTDPVVVASAVEGIDALSHQAAMVGLGVDFDDVRAYTHDNCLGTATLLQALHRSGFAGRLVLASSMVVYGEGRYRCPAHDLVRAAPRSSADLARGQFEPRCPHCARPLEPLAVTEDAPLDPRNVYAATKVHQEQLCSAFATTRDDVTVTALRYHNVYGPRMPRDTPYAGVASIFRSSVERGEPPLVFEDGNQLRDFVHVSDVAAANVLALTGERPGLGAFNIASGSPRTVLDLATELARAAGPQSPPPEVVGGGRPGDVRHVFASPERARLELDFVAQVPFAEGVQAFASAPLR